MTNKKLDIYGTLGPMCCDVDTLFKMFKAGMTGIRLNLSHVDLCDCAEWLGNLNEAVKKAECDCKLLVDLKGPELRIGVMEPALELVNGETVTLGRDIPVPEIVLPALKEGQEVLLDDGTILLKVIKQIYGGAECEILRGGVLKSRKSIALPDSDIYPPADRERR